MPFYIRNIHPEDAHYKRREKLIGNKISGDAVIRESIGDGVFSVRLAHIKYMDSCLDHFYAVELQWEDY